MGKHILVVGCGITGAITTKLLKLLDKCESVTIWEKCRNLGGRFNTETEIGDNGYHNELMVDLGAQYITTTEETVTKYNDVYSDLFFNTIIVEMQRTVKGMKEPKSNIKNYVAPGGMKSVVKFILDDAKCNVCFGRKVIALNKDSNTWQAVTVCGKKEQFDVVILTIPVPEILKLSGDWKYLLEDECISDKLNCVKYSSRFALGVFFEKGVRNDYDAEYIDNDPILRFIAYDSWKSNNKKEFRSAAVHTTIQFGEINIDKDLEDVKKTVLTHLTENVFPHWPKPSSVITLCWKYSQVLCPYDKKPGAITLLNCPLLIAGGDGFIGSTFDQCIYSAKTVVDIVLKQLNC